MTALGGLASGFFSLAASRFGVALGEAGATPTAHALIARLVSPRLHGTAIGLYSMGIPLGTMVAFIGGGVASDLLGWRWALIGAGALGLGLSILLVTAAPRTPARGRVSSETQSFVRTCLILLTSRSYRWLVISAVCIGFASAPFYAFSAPFLIRTHELTASQVGVAFGLLQGGLGVLGTLGGGRGFDRAIRSGHGGLLRWPAVFFLVSGFSTLIALFAASAPVAILMMTPAMISFAFLLPWSFGAAHLVAGDGRQAMASSLLIIASGLLGPATSPVFVGLISDAIGSSGRFNGLQFGLLIAPLAMGIGAICLLVADREVSRHRSEPQR